MCGWLGALRISCSAAGTLSPGAAAGGRCAAYGRRIWNPWKKVCPSICITPWFARSPPRASRTAGHQCPPPIRSAADLAIWWMVTASVSHEECDATHRIATGQHLMIELEVPGPMHACRQSRKGRARKALCETRNIRGINLVYLRVLGASVPPRSVHSSSSSKITLRFFCASTSIL